MRLVLIGYGRWGKKLANCINREFNVDLQIADKTNWKNLVETKPAGVIICTRPESHVEIAEFVLEKNIPTMIEKPLSLSYNEAQKLKQYSAPILVNHLHLFSPAFETICKLSKSPKMMFSMGANDSANSGYELFDYGSHEIAMGIYLTKQSPVIYGAKYFDGNYFIGCNYADLKHNFIIGHSKEKVRLLFVKDDDNEFIYNDTIENKLLINGLVHDVEKSTTLHNSLKCFFDAIEGKKDDRLGVDLSLEVIKALEVCRQKLY